MVVRSVAFVWAGLLASTALAQTTGALPYAPRDAARAADVRAYVPTDFRQAPPPPAAVATQQNLPSTARNTPLEVVPPTAYVPDYRTRSAEAPDYRTRPADSRWVEPRQESRQDFRQEQRQIIDFRPTGKTLQRPQPTAAPVVIDEKLRAPVYEARPGVVDPRVIVPRREEFIDYKTGPNGALDFRPHDFRPVDDRSMEYRSIANRTPDQRVNDPRLKEKGPDTNVVLDCRALQYRAVECNYLDYREIDPRLQELFAKYPEVSFGIVPREYTKDMVERWQPLLNHLSAQIGLRLTLKVANDYQALMEAQRAGLVHVAIYSPIAFARSRQAGIKLDPVAVEANTDGSKGSYSIIYTLAPRNAPAPRMEDLRGKSLGYVDPNSVSGYFIPRMMLNAQKIDADTALSKQLFTGSHENALIALSQGLVDFAVGHWVSEEDSTLTRLLAKGLLKNADGTPLRREDFRVVMKSEPAMNGAVAMLSDMPDDLKALIRRAILEAPMRERASFDRVYEGRGRWEPVDAKAYDGATELVRFMDDIRAKAMSQPRQQALR